jgi:diguanylate cyclase (GGDEF)-like protein
VIVDNATLGTGLRVAERLRRSIEGKIFPLIQGGQMTMTISIGITFFGDSKNVIQRDPVLKAADLALYQAKHAGRNRTVVGYVESEKVIA